MMQLIEYTLMLSGVCTVLASLVMYYFRSQQVVSIGKLLKGRIELNAREFLLNRVGLYVLVMGLLARYVNQVA